MKQGKMFFISVPRLFFFSRKSNIRILDIQIYLCHQMPKHKKEIHLTEELRKYTQPVNEILPVYIILQKILQKLMIL